MDYQQAASRDRLFSLRCGSTDFPSADLQPSMSASSAIGTWPQANPKARQKANQAHFLTTANKPKLELCIELVALCRVG
jgi:hypothetical protein